MKKTNSKIITTIAVLLMFSCSLVAQPFQRQQTRQEDHPVNFIPGLTEEQKEQIREIQLETRKSVQPLRDEMSVNQAKLNMLVRQDDPDINKITGIVKANADLQVKTEMLSIESRIRTRSLLNEEQKILFDARDRRMGNRAPVRQLAHRGHSQGRRRMDRPRW